MLSALSLRVPNDDILLQISKMDGERFKAALASAINNDVSSGLSLRYLNNVSYALSQTVSMRLAHLGFSDIPSSVLVQIGIKEGDAFRQHLSHAVSNNKPYADMSYLRSVLTAYGWVDSRGGSAEQFSSAVKEAITVVLPVDVRPITSLTEVEKIRHIEQGLQHNEKSDDVPPYLDNMPDNDLSCQPVVRTKRNLGIGVGSATKSDGAVSNVAAFPMQHRVKESDAVDVDGYASRHIYGGKNAICFNADEKKNGEKTVRIEAAMAVRERQYDWKDKISIQLSHQEMIGVFSVFMGWVPSFEGKGHGVQSEKSFSVKMQDHDIYKFYLSVNCKDKASRSAPISAFDGARLATFLLSQMLKNEVDIDQALYVQMLKHFATLLAKK